MGKKEWKMISKKQAFKNKWVDIEEWKMQVGPDHVGHYFIEHARDVVVVFPITKENHVIVLKEYYIAHEQYVYSLPAGVVDDNDHEKTAKAELLEEAGGESKEWTYLGSNFLAKYKTGQVHYYLAENVEIIGQPALEPSEDIEVLNIPVTEFLALLRKNEVQDQAEVACAYHALDHLTLL